MKTLSSEHHMSCTFTHCSNVSAASFKLAKSSVASSRNGATWRIVRKVCICMMDSSSSSVRMPVPWSVGMGLLFQSLNVNSRISLRGTDAVASLSPCTRETRRVSCDQAVRSHEDAIFPKFKLRN